MRRKIISITRNNDFRRLYRRKAEVAPCLVTYISTNRLGINRVGITTATKIGKAHDRNRARRVIREAYRLLMPELKSDTGLDIVFVARVRTTGCHMNEVLRSMRKHLSPYLSKDEKTV